MSYAKVLLGILRAFILIIGLSQVFYLTKRFFRVLGIEGGTFNAPVHTPSLINHTWVFLNFFLFGNDLPFGAEDFVFFFVFL